MLHSRPPRDPPPFMANAILNFHFDFLHPSLSFLRCPPRLNSIPKLLLSLPGIAAVGCFYIDVAAPSSWTLPRPVAKILQYLAPAISPPPPLLSFCNNTSFTLACHLKSTGS